MYCLTLITDNSEQLLEVLRKSRVKFSVGSVREEGSRPLSVSADAAQRIYDLVANSRLTYETIAERQQVSYHTILRIIKNPKKYGVRGARIKRS